jgi:glycosyltransferase involved in cell wall biosynthesis
VTIYASQTRLSHVYSSSLTDVRVHAFNRWLSLAKFQVTPGLIAEARDQVRYFDIIHMHNYRTFQNVVVHHYAMKYGVPYVLQAHGSLATFFQKGRLKRGFDILCGYQILKDATKFLAVTEAETEQYRHLGVDKSRIEIVPHGIDLAEFQNLPLKGEFRQRYGLSTGHKVILYLGRIHKIKGLNLLAQAFSCLAKSRTDIRLVIAGPDDGYFAHLKKMVTDLQISDQVIFTGPLYERDKLQAYVDADVYVLPSSYEIFGITVLEALACSTPVVITDRCGIAGLVNGQAGLAVPHDKDQLQDAILHMLSDEGMRLDFGRRGRLLVQERYNWARIAGQIEAIYRSLLSNQ